LSTRFVHRELFQSLHAARISGFLCLSLLLAGSVFAGPVTPASGRGRGLTGARPSQQVRIEMPEATDLGQTASSFDAGVAALEPLALFAVQLKGHASGTLDFLREAAPSRAGYAAYFDGPRETGDGRLALALWGDAGPAENLASALRTLRGDDLFEAEALVVPIAAASSRTSRRSLVLVPLAMVFCGAVAVSRWLRLRESRRAFSV